MGVKRGNQTTTARKVGRDDDDDLKCHVVMYVKSAYNTLEMWLADRWQGNLILNTLWINAVRVDS